jgi:hypothetical protein
VHQHQRKTLTFIDVVDPVVAERHIAVIQPLVLCDRQVDLYGRGTWHSGNPRET